MIPTPAIGRVTKPVMMRSSSFSHLASLMMNTISDVMATRESAMNPPHFLIKFFIVSMC